MHGNVERDVPCGSSSDMGTGAVVEVDASPFEDVGGMGSESRRMSETPFLYVKDFLDRAKSQSGHTKSE